MSTQWLVWTIRSGTELPVLKATIVTASSKEEALRLVGALPSFYGATLAARPSEPLTKRRRKAARICGGLSG
jgi:hypothetical protein